MNKRLGETWPRKRTKSQWNERDQMELWLGDHPMGMRHNQGLWTL